MSTYNNDADFVLCQMIAAFDLVLPVDVILLLFENLSEGLPIALNPPDYFTSVDRFTEEDVKIWYSQLPRRSFTAVFDKRGTMVSNRCWGWSIQRY